MKILRTIAAAAIAVGCCLGITARAATVTFQSVGGSAQKDGNITVPIKVQGFSSVSSVQFTLQWDTSVLEYVSSGDFGLPSLAGANFNTLVTATGKMGLSWEDQSGNGATLSDGTTIFSVTFKGTGAAGTSSTVAFVDSPTPREVSVDLSPVAFGESVGTVTIAAGPEPVWTPPAGIAYGTALSATQLNATMVETGYDAPVYTPPLGTVLGAGTQTLNVSFTKTGTTETATKSVSIVVAKAPLTITAENKSKVYGAALPLYSAVYSGFVNSESESVLIPGVSLTSTATASSAAGTYNIVPSAAAASNYDITFQNGTLTVSKAPLTVTVANASREAGFSNPQLSGSITGAASGDDITATYATSATLSSSAGTYEIVATLVDPGSKLTNYTVTNNPGVLTVTPAVQRNVRVVSTTVRSGESGSFAVEFGANGDENAVAFSLVFDPSLITVTGITADSSVSGASLTSNTTQSSQGKVGVLWSVQSGTTVTAGTRTLVNVAFTAQGAPGSTAAISFSDIPAAREISNTSAGALTGVFLDGVVTIQPRTIRVVDATVKSGDTGSFSIEIDSQGNENAVAFSLAFDPTVITVTGVAADSSVTGASLTSNLTQSSLGKVGVLWNLQSGNTLSAGTRTLVNVAFTAVGDPGTSSAVTFTDAPAAREVSDSSAGALSSVFANGTVSVAAGDIITWNIPTGITYGTALGASQLNATIGNSQNYGSPVYDPAVGTVLSAGTHTSSVTFTKTGTTETASKSIQITVGKAPLTVTAENKIVLQGQAFPAFTAAYAGFVGSDSPQTLTTPVTVTTSAADTATLGEFAITPCCAVSPNYDISFVDGKLTVVPPGVPIIGWATPAAIGYGTALAGTHLNATATDPITGATVIGTFDYSPALGTVLDAGVGQDLSVLFTPADLVNYTSTSSTVKINVNKMPLSITVDNKSKVFGDANPELTAVYAGFVNGDTAASLTSPAVLSTSATASSAAGSYPISISGATSPNYEISLVDGTMTVTQLPLTITVENATKAYGANLPVLSLTYNGFREGETEANLTTPTVLETTATAASNVGSYAITVSGATSPNYSIIFVNGTLTVTPVALSVTAENKTKVYGAPTPALTAVYSGFVNNDTEINLDSAVVLATAAENSGVGVYPITASGGADANYIITFTGGELTITPAPLTIAADSKESLYGRPVPGLTFSFTGLANGDSASSLGAGVTVSSIVSSASDVGVYPISISGGENPNYTVILQAGTLTVKPAPLTVSVKAAGKTANDPNPVFEGRVIGLRNNDNITATYATIANASSPVGNYEIVATLIDPDNRLPNYNVNQSNGILKISQETFYAGVAQDGYVAGATVFFDANKNGTKDANEPSTTTDAQGKFTLAVLVTTFDTNSNGKLDPAEGTMVLTGGTDIATGVPNQTQLTAPPGSTVVTPLTTLVAATLEKALVTNPNATVAGAEAQVSTAMGIPAGIELTKFDPVAEAGNNAAGSKEVFNASAKLQDTLVQVSSVVSGSNTAAKAASSAAALDVLAGKVSAGGTLNLSQSAEIQSIITESATKVGGTVSAENLSAASQIISESNQVKDTAKAAAGSALDVAKEISRIQVVAQTQTSAVLEGIKAGTTTATEAVTKSTGTALTQSVTAAAVGDVTGLEERPGTFAFSKSAFEAATLGTSANVIIGRVDGNIGVVNLTISLKNSAGVVSATSAVSFADREVSKTIDLLPLINATTALAGQSAIPLELALAAGASVDTKLGTQTTSAISVNVAPSITKQPESLGVTLGSTGTFTVTATGIPAVSYQWRKNGTVIPGQTGTSLIILNAGTSDSAVYSVIVSNSAGSVTSAGAALNVGAPPIIFVHPVSQQLPSGSGIRLSVLAEGQSPFTYQWLKDGKEIAGATGRVLDLVNLSATNAGAYRARVGNRNGSSLSGEAQLTIRQTPFMTAFPESVVAKPGSSVSFSAGVGGTGPLIYQWAKDGRAIAGANVPTLMLDNVQNESGGFYTFSASNGFGEVVSATAGLTVRLLPVAPGILVHPGDKTVAIGEAVTWSVSAVGSTPLGFQWFRDGVPISGATGDSYSITAAAVADAGTYSVRVSNSEGSATSAGGRLRILSSEAPIFLMQPLSQNVQLGAKALLQATASGADPLSYQWYKDGAKVVGAASAKLELPSAKVSDAGSYILIVSSPGGSVSSLNAVLKVSVDRPIIGVQPVGLTVDLGGSANMTVSASGGGNLSYQWYKNDVMIQGASGATLNLASVAIGDSGEYHVVVTNEGGSTTSANAALTVKVLTSVKSDFNGDGSPDIVFQDDNSFLAVWNMNKGSFVSSAFLLPSQVGEPNWTIAGSGDFNGNGKEDLVFQHVDGTMAIWLMDGVSSTASVVLNPSNPGDSKWRVASAGDMNADFKTDLVFQHEDGTLAVWFLDGTKLIASRLLEPSHPGDPGWRVRGLGDFNVDGKQDLLFQHVDGRLAVWALDGGVLVEAFLLDPVSTTEPQWVVKGVADFDLDQKADILFQRSDDGSMAIWYMDGKVLRKAALTDPVQPGGLWKVVAPR